jgi:hypothetical protein
VRLCRASAGAEICRGRASRDRFRYGRGKNQDVEFREILYRAHSAKQNSAICEQPAFWSDQRFLEARRSGRDHHLRSHAAERIPRAGSELRGKDSEVDPAAPTKGTVGGAGVDDLSGNDGRTGSADSGKKRLALPHCLGHDQ